MSKTKDKIKVSFLGEASNDVTGSMILIESSHHKILLECGLYQSCKFSSPLGTYKINNEKFAFKAKEIDYVFMNHLHVDHLGRLPLLFKRGGTPRIIGVEKTKDLAKILLDDSAHIMSSDAIEISKRLGREYLPIFEKEDVEKCLNYYEEYPINEIIELDEYIKFQFVPSGHIFNSAQLILWIKEGNLTKKIVYTSDLGNIHIDKYYSNTFEPITKCDLFIGETTYAGNEKIATNKVRKHDLEKLKSDIFFTCLENKSRLLIPVFAMDRCQNMLTHIYNLMANEKDFKNIPVYVDSPMAINMCKQYYEILEGEEAELWRKVLCWDNLHFVESSEESKNIRDSKQPCVVLSSSGMIVPRGRSAGWACSMLPRVNDKIAFCGYSAEGSIGYIIKEGKQKSITISGKRCANKCQVTNLTSFSSHMQRDSLLQYYGSVDAPKIALVHGDMTGKINFAKDLRKELSKNNLTTKVSVVQKGCELFV